MYYVAPRELRGLKRAAENKTQHSPRFSTSRLRAETHETRHNTDQHNQHRQQDIKFACSALSAEPSCHMFPRPAIKHTVQTR